MDCKKFLESNFSHIYSVKIKGNVAIVPLSSEAIDFNSLKRIVSMISAAIYSPRVTKVKFTAAEIDFSDKLSYILFECLIYTLIKDYGKEVFFDVKRKNLHITTAGIKDSLLLGLISGEKSNGQFLKAFGEFSINLEHYRRVVPCNKPLEYLSGIFTEIKTFLFNSCMDIERKSNTRIDHEYLERVAEMVIELANNAYEHAGADCLIDIDITKDWISKAGNKVFAINLAVVDFSNVLIGDRLFEKFEKLEAEDLENTLLSKYATVRQAYEYHKQFFNSEYTSADFFTIASFQNKISSREKKSTGGTGLPQMLKMLMEQTELDLCYMISGNKGIFFVLENLEFKDGWVGFNKTHDFISDIPDSISLLKHDLFFPGCAFNLNLVLKMEEC